MDMSRLWVSTTGDTRVQISQQTSSNANRCTISVNGSEFITGTPPDTDQWMAERDVRVQIFTQIRAMYIQMADTWDSQGKNTSQLRTDLNLMDQKINQLSQEQNESNIRNDSFDIQQFMRQTIHQDIRLIILQKL